jgi:ATP-dependent helicase/nuclease subunit B
VSASARQAAYAAHVPLLEAGATIVTSSRREARELERADTERRRAAGRCVWETPPILPWAVWLEHCHRQSDGDLPLLSATLALRLWQAIVAESPAGRSLIDVRGAARGAQQAFALAAEYGLPLATVTPQTEEQAAFLGWARRFAEECAERRVRDASTLPGLIAAAHTPVAGSVVGWHGFGTLPPARARLAAALAQRGVAVQRLTARGRGARVLRAAPATAEDELGLISAWLIARLTEDPDARLAVVLPDLRERQAALRRFLDDRLQPALLGLAADEERRYALATAPALAERAVVDSALLVLALGQERCAPEAISRLLRSPYLPGALTERGARAELEATLRERRAPLSPAELERKTLAFAARLQALRASIRAARTSLAGPARRFTAAWAEAFARALRAAGWTRDQPASSEEFQTIGKWYELLETFATLGAVTGPIDLVTALDELRGLAAQTEFQPEEGEPAVVFLDGLHDPGYAVDGLWVAGLSAERFPAPSAPQPFLPLSWQRAQGVPRASAEIELSFARELLAAWPLRCTELVLSCPARDADGEIVASPLLPVAPAPTELSAPASRALELYVARRLEDWQDSALPPIGAGDPIPGGTRPLELQSACPFRAGAEQRLGAKALAARTAGLAPIERGLLAHVALRRLWEELGGHAALVALGDEARRAAIARAVDGAWAERAVPMDSRHHALEREWLARALEALLEDEAKRPPFVVEATEAERLGSIDGHPVRLRFDRLDRDAAGTVILLDYKTGTVTPRKWTGDRPDAVQLLTYATQLAEAPRVLAYALLPLAGKSFVGLAERTGLLPGVKGLDAQRHSAMRGRDWASLVAEWQRTTTRLARTFAAGEAQVDPTPEACRHCPLGALCRIEAPLTTGRPADYAP